MTKNRPVTEALVNNHDALEALILSGGSPNEMQLQAYLAEPATINNKLITRLVIRRQQSTEAHISSGRLREFDPFLLIQAYPEKSNNGVHTGIYFPLFALDERLVASTNGAIPRSAAGLLLPTEFDIQWGDTEGVLKPIGRGQGDIGTHSEHSVAGLATVEALNAAFAFVHSVGTAALDDLYVPYASVGTHS
ncbi:MAG TPA: hypothetical protein VLE73_03190 [Candidatus Saccharimonadales bacterium]|nr:hypothetical protein [Candidatus Saccharimonadales bacterium]